MNYLISTITFSAILIIALRIMGKKWYRKGENSGELWDVYTLSHFLHGVIFFLVFSLLPVSLAVVYLISMVIETAWEIVENTPWVIKKYRKKGHPTYEGDSIVNSLFDLIACGIGFFVAFYFPWWANLLIILAVEVGMYLAVGDNLLLNILSLLLPEKKQT